MFKVYVLNSKGKCYTRLETKLDRSDFNPFLYTILVVITEMEKNLIIKL